MFLRLRGRVFGNQVIDQVVEYIKEATDIYITDDCIGSFGIVVSKDTETGKIPKNLGAQYIKMGLNMDEAAVSLLDGCVGSLKQLSNEPTPKMEAIIEGFEQTIDHVMKIAPGRVLPRHGSFARAAEDVGFDKFFKEV